MTKESGEKSEADYRIQDIYYLANYLTFTVPTHLELINDDQEFVAESVPDIDELRTWLTRENEEKGWLTERAVNRLFSSIKEAALNSRTTRFAEFIEAILDSSSGLQVKRKLLTRQRELVSGGVYQEQNHFIAIELPYERFNLLKKVFSSKLKDEKKLKLKPRNRINT